MSHSEPCARNSLVSERRRVCEGKAREQATAVVLRRWCLRKGGPGVRLGRMSQSNVLNAVGEGE